MRKLFITFLCFLFVCQGSVFAETTREDKLKEQNAQTEQFPQAIEDLYDLPEGVDIQEITDKLLVSPFIKNKSKEAIIATSRRTFIFRYPSDGLKIKGYISFVSQTEDAPIIVELRGGNRKFAIPSPGSGLATLFHRIIKG